MQGWPGVVHGGGLVALLDSVAAALSGRSAPRIIEGRLTSSVPTDTELVLEARATEEVIGLTVLRDGQTLASGNVSAGSGERRAPATWSGGADGWSVPRSEHCLACGAFNAVGLQASLFFNEDGVWTRLPPRAPWRTGGGLHAALGPVLLDEIAWWLGALVTREGGLTNRIRVALIAPDAPWDAPLIAAGRFDAVRPVDRKRAFWRTETALMGVGGELLATASIVFRGGPEYSARQLDYLRPRTPKDVFQRMFPNYARR